MESLVNFLNNSTSLENKALFFSLVIVSIVFLYPLLLKKLPGLISPSRFLELFFLRDQEEGRRYEKVRLYMLEREVRSLKERFSDESLKDSKNKVNKLIDDYLERNLASLIANKVEQDGALENLVVKSFESRIVERLDNFLESLDAGAIAKLKAGMKLSKELDRSQAELESIVEIERKNASLLKNVMINLFVVVNIGMLLMYAGWSNGLSQSTALLLSGVYVSLATFIVYVLRASNSRTSALLAIKEDMRKHASVYSFIVAERSGEEITQNDVELIRMLLINRAEREKKVDHPYEVILKGVSDSNIQLKGGKMLMSKGTKNKGE